VNAASPSFEGSDEAMRAKLKSAIVPRVTFSMTPLSSVLTALEMEAANHEIEVSISMEGDSDPPVSITLRNLSFEKVLDFLTESVGFQWTIQDGVIRVRPRAPGAITGRLFAADTGQALEGVVVMLVDPAKNSEAMTSEFEWPSTSTDSEGRYSFGEVDSGLYELRFNKSGYRTALLRDLEVWSGSVSEADFALPPLPPDLGEVFELEAFSVLAESVDGFAPSRSIDFVSAADFSRYGAPSVASEFNTEGYERIEDSGFRSPLIAPRSTFSIDVDTASYANVRRLLNNGAPPPPDAVRIEELINYFPYDYDGPKMLSGADPKSNNIRELVEHPFAVNCETARAPWAVDHFVVKIGIQGFEVDWDNRPPLNLVFLLDVSGSMKQQDKLPLVVESLRHLVRRLDGRDRVAVVVYAGASGLVLPSTTANNQETILHALEQLDAGGSTNAGEGIELAYAQAREHFIEDGANRVILCTDGDFNVGVTSRGDLTRVIEDKAKDGVYLTVLGFGMGNYKDDMLETLSNKGNGNYGYIDTPAEARKLFGRETAGSMLTIAKDVKIQVEFNPALVKAYRLIGYENRELNDEDFNDDTVDAGELGSGHSVTALYEIAPHDSKIELPEVDELKYQSMVSNHSDNGELMTLKLRYKWPDRDDSRLLSKVIMAKDFPFAKASADFRFACAVAGWGMLLRDSKFKGDIDSDWVTSTAEGAMGDDPGGFRDGFLALAAKSEALRKAKGEIGEDNTFPN